MPDLSRRQVLQSLGTASTVALASLAMPAYGKQTRKHITVPDPKSLYLIFPGAWAFCYENGKLLAVTTDFKEHTYDLGLSLPTGLPRLPLKKDQTYSVDIGKYTPAKSIQDLVSPMVAAKQGMIFKNIQRKQTPPAGLRTISLPLPSSISPAALVTGAYITIDPTQTQIPSIKEWPAALALVYSGSWEFATVSVKDDSQTPVTIVSGSLPHPHLSFRTCLTASCDMPPDCTISCAEIEHEIKHVRAVYASMMDMFDFQGKTIPTIDFPACVADPSGVGGRWPVGIDPGDDPNIDKSEIGIPGTTCVFANLHNCAAGTMIIGA